MAKAFISFHSGGRTSHPVDIIDFAKLIRSIPKNRFDCQLWPGARDPDSYGKVTIDGKRCYAHRESYKLFNGPLDPGFFACHTCDTPPCVNPEHLFAGTHTENMLDMVKKGRSGKTRKLKQKLPFHKPIQADDDGPKISIEKIQGSPLIVSWSNLGGWMATWNEHNILNPYTKTLFTHRKSCVRVARFFVAHGFYPGLKPNIVKDRRWIIPKFYKW